MLSVWAAVIWAAVIWAAVTAPDEPIEGRED